MNQRQEEIGVKIRILTLHHRGDALEAGAGIDRRARQRGQLPVGRAIELHEHQIPDLEEASCLGLFFELRLGDHGGARSPVGLIPLEVDVDLRAGTARTSVPHLPEVVLVPQTIDPVIGKPGDLAPQRARLVVGLVHGDPKPVRSQPEIFRPGHELPGERDRLALEVVAEGEVAQHLEEGVVPLGVPHLLEIVVFAPGAHALLAGRSPQVVAPLLTQERPLELHHAGIGEQQRRVVGRDQ